MGAHSLDLPLLRARGARDREEMTRASLTKQCQQLDCVPMHPNHPRTCQFGIVNKEKECEHSKSVHTQGGP